MSDYSNKRTHRAFIATVYAMQGVGIVFAALVPMILSGIFLHFFPAASFKDDPVFSTQPEVDYLWRIVLMLGGLPALLTYHFRMKMPQKNTYTAIIERNAKQAAEVMTLNSKLNSMTNYQHSKLKTTTHYSFTSSFVNMGVI